jgi:hypothetical protein
MLNIELLLNPHIAPVYVSTTNIVYAISKLTFDEIYQRLTVFGNSVFEMSQIMYHTSKFILQQLYKEMYVYLSNNALTTEKLVFLLAIYMLLLMVILFTSIMRDFNQTNKEFQKQKETINSLKKQIKILEIARNDSNEVWTDELKNLHNRYAILDKKFKKIEPKLSRLQKEMKAYE